MPLTHLQLPPVCLLVQQQAWTFQVSLVQKRKVSAQRWCQQFGELVEFVTRYQLLLPECPVYLKLSEHFQYEPLSYEQALTLSQSE